MVIIDSEVVDSSHTGDKEDTPGSSGERNCRAAASDSDTNECASGCGNSTASVSTHEDSVADIRETTTASYDTTNLVPCNLHYLRYNEIYTPISLGGTEVIQGSSIHTTNLRSGTTNTDSCNLRSSTDATATDPLHSGGGYSWKYPQYTLQRSYLRKNYDVLYGIANSAMNSSTTDTIPQQHCVASAPADHSGISDSNSDDSGTKSHRGSDGKNVEIYRMNSMVYTNALSRDELDGVTVCADDDDLESNYCDSAGCYTTPTSHARAAIFRTDSEHKKEL
uniref:60S ribosomal protein L26 n=1 Tax=Lygus hesperus TaxID=30085 RepID=A0A0A9WMN8_LYGHE